MSTSLLNRSKVRDFALVAAGKRSHRFTRVSESFLSRCEGQLREFIRLQIARLPSKGKTIR